MGKGKTMAITAVATCGLAAALILAASMTNLFLAGDYYVKIDNAHISENESSGGVINLGSSGTYISLRRSTRRVIRPRLNSAPLGNCTRTPS